MRRFEPMRQAIGRIHDGALGEVTGGQVVRTGDAMRNWREDEKNKRAEWSEIDYAIRRWLFWTWLSGDFIVEMHVHNLDIMNWIMGAHPVSCMAMGGRQARTEPEFGNIYDHFSAEYVYPDDVRIEYMGAQIDKFTYRNNQRVQGTMGSAYLDFANSKITGQHSWEYDGTHPNPAVQEYADMIESIREGKAINEAQQVAEGTLTAIMGRMSAYTGRELKWEWARQASTLDLTPQDSPAGPAPDTSVAIPGVTELI
jgi:predicted dehydrogenase